MADDFVVNDSVVKSVDMVEFSKFLEDSPKLVEEFENIKKDFNKVNEDLLKVWVGEGADEYKYETDHILEKIGDLKAIIEAINITTINEIRQKFSDADAELAKFNREQASDEE